MKKLTDVKVAILVTDGFEQVELTEPKNALEGAGANVEIVSPKDDKVKAWNKTDWGIEVAVDKKLDKVNVDDYHALVLPGGQINPDKLRAMDDAVKFTRSFFEKGKPVAAICHGPWTLIEADVVAGRNLTSYHSIKTDLINAGANWVDKEVVVDGGLITSRNPGDLEIFNKTIINEFSMAAQEVNL